MNKSLMVGLVLTAFSCSAPAETVSFKGIGVKGSCQVSYSLNEKSSIKSLTIIGQALFWEKGNLDAGETNYNSYEMLDSRDEGLIMKRDFNMKKTLLSSYDFSGKGRVEQGGTSEILISGRLNNPSRVTYTQKYKLFGLIDLFSFTFDCKR